MCRMDGLCGEKDTWGKGLEDVEVSRSDVKGKADIPDSGIIQSVAHFQAFKIIALFPVKQS